MNAFNVNLLLTLLGELNIDIMYRGLCVVLILVWVPLWVVGQGASSFNNQLFAHGRADETTQVSFHSFLSDIHSDQFKSDQALLHYIFKKAHKVFLREYQAYADLSEVFTTGKYDCLSGTAFFTMVLQNFDFQFSLIETNYHIFLMVHTTKGDVLLETTDKTNGFISDPDVIQQRIGIYRHNSISSNPIQNKKIYLYHFNLYNEISPEKLQGLLYFNKAIKAFNNKDWESATDWLEKAKGIYDSPRIEELAYILIQSTNANEVDDAKKQKITSRLREYLLAKSFGLASL